MPSFGLKPFVRRSMIGFGARLPLDVLARSVPRDVIVLMYHAVGEDAAAHLRNLYPYKTPAQFEADLVSLKQEFPMPTWEEFVANRGRSQRPDRPSVLITFDDGLSHCYRFVRPLLLKHRVPCLFFITKAFVDNRTMFFRHKASLCVDIFRRLSLSDQNRVLNTLVVDHPGCSRDPSAFGRWMLGLGHIDQPTIDRVCSLLDIDTDDVLKRQQPYVTKEEIQQLHSDGFTIGGHSVTHPPLRVLSAEEVEFEILQSCRFIRELLNVKDVPFAFPFSADGVSRPVLRRIAQRNPWISAMFGSNNIDLDEPFLLNRINVDHPPDRGAARSDILKMIKTTYANAFLRSVTASAGKC